MFCIVLMLFCIVPQGLWCTIPFDENQSTLNQLIERKIVTDNTIRLHLGCGQVKLQNYINIDFPPTRHSVQKTTAADVFCNITKLKFPSDSVQEIRSHHVFEHFDRSTALALLCAWHRWLDRNGILIIETPDFATSIAMLSDPHSSYIQKQSILRHIFGSHEAPWAIHCDGWYQEKFEHILSHLGFDVIKIEKTSWRLTANIIVTAQKKHDYSLSELSQKARIILTDSLVDQSPSEQVLLDVWFHNFEQALQEMILTA